MRGRHGFTLMELLVVISIITVVGVFSVTPFMAFRQRTVLRAQNELVASILTEARQNTLASKENDTYGVHFESDHVVLFRGDEFDVDDPNNVETTIDPAVEIYDISLSGGGSHVLFQKLSGETEHAGVIGLRLSADHTASTTITIFSSGLITPSE